MKETVEIDPPVREEGEEEWLARNTLRAQGGDESEDEGLAEMLREVHSGKFDYMAENETTGGGQREESVKGVRVADEEHTGAGVSEDFMDK